MAANFYTTQAQTLLKAFDERISQTEQKGKITTWQRITHNNNVYYTHKSDEWGSKAYFTPAISTEKLTFNIIKPDSQNVSVTTYGYYHGHLIETLLNHFDNMFSSGSASALPQSGDKIS